MTVNVPSQRSVRSDVDESGRSTLTATTVATPPTAAPPATGPSPDLLVDALAGPLAEPAETSASVDRAGPAKGAGVDGGANGARHRQRSSIRVILAIATSVIGTQIVTSVLGAGFWAAAARSYPAAQVGVASATTSAMAVLGVLGMLGMGTLLIIEVPRHDRSGQLWLMRAALLVVAITAGVLGLLWAVAARWTSEAMRPLADNPLTMLVFVIGVGLTAVTSVFDQAVLIRGRGGLQFTRNLITAAAKVGLVLGLVALGVTSGFSLYGVWVLAMVISLPVCVLGLVPPGRHTQASGPTGAGWRWGLRELRGHSRSAFGHHVVNLALQAPTLLLPVLAALTVSAEHTAYFSSARLAAAFLFMPPYALAIALYAGAQGDIARAVERARVTLPLGIAVSAGLYVAAAVVAHPLLSLFGREYADRAYTPFLLMALAGIPLVAKDHFVALCRTDGRIRRAAIFVACGTAAELGCAATAGAFYGLNGLAAGWTAAVTLQALALIPVLLRSLRRPRPTARQTPLSP